MCFCEEKLAFLDTHFKQNLPFRNGNRIETIFAVFLWNLPFIEMENRCPYVSVNRLIHEYVNLNDSKLTTVVNHYEY